MGSRTVLLGQWAVSGQGLQSPVGDQAGTAGAQCSAAWPWRGTGLLLAFPGGSSPLLLGKPFPSRALAGFLLQEPVVFGANLGDKSLVKSL